MNRLMQLAIGLALILTGSITTTLASAQPGDYTTFSTNDEQNNIQVFQQASPSVVNITNSRLVRSF